MIAAVDKRTHILAAGAEVMHQKGYNATGVKEIVDAAGVPKGSFYNYFDSKEAFAVEALEFLAAEPKVEFKRILSNPQLSPGRRLLGFYEEHLANLKSSGEFCTGCFIGNLCQEMSDASVTIARKVETVFSDHEEIIAACLEEARDKGEIDGTTDPNVIARFLVAGWQGALMRMKASKTAEPLEAFVTVLKSNILRMG